MGPGDTWKVKPPLSKMHSIANGACSFLPGGGYHSPQPLYTGRRQGWTGRHVGGAKSQPDIGIGPGWGPGDQQGSGAVLAHHLDPFDMNFNGFLE